MNKTSEKVQFVGNRAVSFNSELQRILSFDTGFKYYEEEQQPIEQSEQAQIHGNGGTFPNNAMLTKRFKYLQHRKKLQNQPRKYFVEKVENSHRDVRFGNATLDLDVDVDEQNEILSQWFSFTKKNKIISWINHGIIVLS